MANDELPQPGVEVVQVFRAASPTVITPTLICCVVGVCKQLVEVFNTDSSGSNTLNSNARVQLPAMFEAPSGPYTGLDGLSLVFAVNFGANATVLFSDPLITGLTAATVVTQVNAALTAAKVTSVIAETLGTDQWRLRTVGIGEFQQIYIDPTTSPVVAGAFEIGLGKTYIGLSGYNQYAVTIPDTNFPDPNGNLEEISIETSSIRAFLHMGASTSLYEALRTSAFCKNGVVDDVAAHMGSSDIRQATLPLLYGVGGTLDGQDLNIQFVDGSVINVTLSAPLDEVALIGQIMAAVPAIIASVDTGVAIPADIGKLHLTAAALGYPGTFTLTAGTLDALATLFLTPATYSGYSIEAVDDGNGDAVTPILDLRNENFTAAPTQAVVVGALAMVGTPALGTTFIISDGGQEQTVVFTGASLDTAQVAAEINAVIGPTAGGKITASGGPLWTALTLTHSDSGTDSVFYILGGTALAVLDPSPTPNITIGTFRGVSSKPEPGDELWIDGAYYGNITQVAPGGAVDRVKIDKQLTISPNIGASFFIIAKNLPGSATRPTPQLIIDLNGNAVLKQELLRDVDGNPVITTSIPLYITYTAVRLDVTARASNPGLLKFNNTTEIEATIPPISTANPLALGAYFAALNAPGSQITALGVDAISADSPYGTVEAFTRAAEYLEAFEVYAIAPLTHDLTVGQLFSTHVTAMSEPENKAERIVLWNPDMPEYALDTLVASGTDGNSSGPTGLLFDTKVTNLTTLVTNAGISTTGTIPTSEGLFVDIASDSNHYSVQSISGSTVTIRTVFAAGENDDNFYSTTALNVPPLPAYLVQEQFVVKVRGEELVTVSGDPDKDAIADNVKALGRTFLNRRFWMVTLGSAGAVIGGVDTLVEGFYVSAATVGMISQQPPQQSFTNFPITGFTRAYGTNDTFTRSQMNRMAAGGAYIIIQEAEGTPLIARMALTTDMTSIETRTDSITKIVDMAAKFQRNGLKVFIGRFNITQGFLDTLGTVLDGLLTFLKELGVVVGANVNNIIQDEDAPDTVLIDETLDPPYPCNYLRLTIEV
jgi:hypothetical protein